MNHADLPPAYLVSCQKFFDSIKSEKNNLMKHWAAVAKASSNKLKATSAKRQAAALWKPGLRVKNRFKRKV